MNGRGERIRTSDPSVPNRTSIGLVSRLTNEYRGQLVVPSAVRGRSWPPVSSPVASGCKRRATVLAINRPERMVVLRSEDGGTLGLILDERVRNFDQIQVGDVVTAQYQEATAIFVRPATGAPTSNATGTLQTARPGEKPEAVATRTNEITATVVSIDYPDRIVTLRGPRGGIRTLKAGPEITNFDAVRKGDEVVVRHTEAIAVAVTK